MRERLYMRYLLIQQEIVQCKALITMCLLFVVFKTVAPQPSIIITMVLRQVSSLDCYMKVKEKVKRGSLKLGSHLKPQKQQVFSQRHKTVL